MITVSHSEGEKILISRDLADTTPIWAWTHRRLRQNEETIRY
jgi:hypothetical protein